MRAFTAVIYEIAIRKCFFRVIRVLSGHMFQIAVANCVEDSRCCLILPTYVGRRCQPLAPNLTVGATLTEFRLV